jgi:ABC-type dipeptide/oligopeptide/nickel transport system permease component
MIVAVCTLSALLTMTGFLMADILYAFADPRIKLKGAENG